MIADPKWLFALEPGQRKRFWNRLCRLGIIRERELIGVHRLAQARRITPEAAVVTMGLLTEDQVVEFLTGEAPFGFSMEGMGIS